VGLNNYTSGSYPAAVKLILRSGESGGVEVIFPKGHPDNPMSPAEVEAKFRACARGRISSARQEKVIGKARELENLARCGRADGRFGGRRNRLEQGLNGATWIVTLAVKLRDERCEAVIKTETIIKGGVYAG